MRQLRKIREEKGVTQLRLSMEAGVAQETISGYERGKTMPSVETLCKLADFLGTSTDYLLERTDVCAPVSRLTIDGIAAEELELLSAFRKLPPSRKGKALGFVMGLSEE